MNKKDCLGMAMEFGPNTVQDLITNAQYIYGWATDTSLFFDKIDTEILKLSEPNRSQICSLPDETIEDPVKLYSLIKLFCEEGIEPTASDLIEAGASEFFLYKAFPILEKLNLIERIRKLGHETTVRLKEAA